MYTVTLGVDTWFEAQLKQQHCSIHEWTTIGWKYCNEMNESDDELWQWAYKVKVLHLYTAFFYLSIKGQFTTLTPSRELTQPWCESSPWGDWISEQPTLTLNAVLPYVCWYSFYLPTEGWRAESTPGQVESGMGIEPGTCHMTVHCSTNWAVLARYTYKCV